ncbi:hypothetical protein ACTJJ7_27970, partial [Phyllobacterium sp. 22229]|uniref:hypothetical protein n=1 Tax=Phyllobacterium sp. 22229 TaxID=3453895 RepID=UPI003F85A32E
MSFHATAAAIPARPNTLSIFRNHLLCSVCAALLVMGSGASCAIAPEPVVDAKPPVQEKLAPEQPAGGTEQLAPEPVVDAKPPVPEQPAEAKAITVKSGEEKEFGADKILGDITVNGSAVVRGQMRNGTVNSEGNGALTGFLTLTGSRAKATGTIVIGPDDQAVLVVDSGATANEVIVNGTQSKTGDQKRKGGVVKVFRVGSRIDKSTVNLGGLMIVLREATAGTVTVNSGGKLEVKAKSKVEEVTVNGEKAWGIDADGHFVVGVGGIADVFGAESRVDKGTVNLGGLMIVQDKATAGTITVNTGGKLEVKAKSKVEEITINGEKAWGIGVVGVGGIAEVSGAGSRIDKGTINLGGLMAVRDEVSAGTITVNNGGWLEVRTKSKVEEVTVNGKEAWDSKGENGIGGSAVISGKESRIDKGTINLGGWMQVYDQATAGAITVNSGGWLNVFAGGTAEEVTVNGEKAYGFDAAGLVISGVGGSAVISGKESRIDKGTVNLGGWMAVRDEVSAGTITVNNGGKLDVFAGGTAEEVTVNGKEAYGFDAAGHVISGIGGAAVISGKESRIDKGTVNLGGWMKVYDQATAGKVAVNSGGWLEVNDDGQVEEVTVNGGFADVEDRGEITGKSTVSNGGLLRVFTGGRAGDITLTGGDSAGQTSYAIVKGTAGDITLGANSVLNGSGTVRNLLVRAGGTVYPGTNKYRFATLTATGDVTFDKDSIYTVQIANDGLRASRLEVQGQANLHGGTVKVRAEEYAETDSQGVSIAQPLSKEQVSNLFDKHFVILTAEKGVTGRFEKIEPDYNYITPTLAYTDKTVSLGFDLTGAARTEKAEKLAAEQAAAQTQAEADRLNRQLHEEQIKNIVLVDAV